MVNQAENNSPGGTATPHSQAPAPAAASLETSRDPAAYAALLLQEAREEIGRADQKASILLAGAGVVVGGVLAGILTTGWRPGELGSPWTLLWWAGVAFTLAGLLALFACVYPRMAPSAEHGSQHLFYFANIRDYASTDALKAALTEGAPDPLERTTHQLFHVSRIVHLKFSLIRWGIWLLGLGAAACGVAAVRPF